WDGSAQVRLTSEGFTCQCPDFPSTDRVDFGGPAPKRCELLCDELGFRTWEVSGRACHCTL
ncbi:MAG TPA: hypothetical protein VM686_05280, partial [Polyangiaceae bacterium]|nr:hypothetical protein [Polyangiaceae bacterium]